MLTKTFLGEIAATDPRAACVLARGNTVIQEYRMTIEFSASLVAGQVNSVYLNEPMGDDFFVTDVRSTVNRPLAFAGSIFKGQADVFNSQNSNIDVKLTVQGGLPGAGYVIQDAFTPLELVAPPATSPTSPILCNFMLGTTQTIKGEFVWNRAMADDENPTRVTIVFKGWRLGCTMYLGLTVPQAREALRVEFGI